MTCNNCGAEVIEGMKFCADCGALLSKKCVSCGNVISAKAKFCSECGAPQREAEARKSEFNTADLAIGNKNVIAGDVVKHREETVIKGNATIIKNEDESKQVKCCHICGRYVLVTEGFECQECGEFTCKSCYDENERGCYHCVKRRTTERESVLVEEYVNAVKAAIADGGIDLRKRQGLDRLKKNLGLSDEIANKLEMSARGIDNLESLTRIERFQLRKIYEEVYDYEGDFLENLHEVEEMYLRHPMEEECLAVYLPLLELNGEYDKVIKIVSELRADIPSCYIAAIDALFVLDNLVEVEKWLKKALLLFPDNNVIKCYQIYYYLKMFSVTGTEKLLEEAVAIRESLHDVKESLELSHQIRVMSLFEKQAGEEPPTYEKEFCKENDLFFRVLAHIELNGIFIQEANVKETTVLVTGVSLDWMELQLMVNDLGTLTATVEPKNAFDSTVNWSVEPEGVVTLTDNGDGRCTVKALEGGRASITVKTVDGGKTALCKVTVAVPVITNTAFIKAVEASMSREGLQIDWIKEANGTVKLTRENLQKIQSVRSLYIVGSPSEKLTDLSGIEWFTRLTELDCCDNQLTSLDVSGCTALTKLVCGHNQLTSLDVSACTALTNLKCWGNQLTTLDVSGCTALTCLECPSNQLTTLDVSGCTALTELSCIRNQLTSLDVSACTALTDLSCWGNQLTSLDVSACTALTYLDCSGNQLTSLDVSACTALTHLGCSCNQLTSLDVSGFTALTDLSCWGNQLTSLDVSKNAELVLTLQCGKQRSGTLTLILTAWQKKKWMWGWLERADMLNNLGVKVFVAKM